MHMLRTVAVAMSVVVGAACGDSLTTPTPGENTVTRVNVVVGSTSGPTFRLTAMADLTDGTTQDVTSTATWDSANPNIATVTAGLVTVYGSGEVEIRATYRNVAGSARVLVATVPVEAVTISGAPTGRTFQLAAIARLGDGSTANVTQSAVWESSRPDIATVSATGLVTVLGSGEVEIRATYRAVTGAQRYTVSSRQSFVVSGVVRALPDSRPVAGAAVRTLVGVVPVAITDAEGAFRIDNVPEGRILLEVSKQGYEIWSSDLTVSGDVRMTIELRPEDPEDLSVSDNR